ncbi:hypothetical protein ACIPH4_40330, partial [Streptomyces tendae]
RTRLRLAHAAPPLPAVRGSPPAAAGSRAAGAARVGAAAPRYAGPRSPPPRPHLRRGPRPRRAT